MKSENQMFLAGLLEQGGPELFHQSGYGSEISKDCAVVSQALASSHKLSYTVTRVFSRTIGGGQESIYPEALSTEFLGGETLEANGIVRLGTLLQKGSPLVGVVRYLGSRTTEERLLEKIFGENMGVKLDASLRYDLTEQGIVLATESHGERENGIVVNVTVGILRTLQEGDELIVDNSYSIRIGRIVPVETLPTCGKPIRRPDLLWLDLDSTKSDGRELFSMPRIGKARAENIPGHLRGVNLSVRQQLRESKVSAIGFGRHSLFTGQTVGEHTVSPKMIKALLEAGYLRNVAELCREKTDIRAAIKEARRQLSQTGTYRPTTVGRESFPFKLWRLIALFRAFGCKEIFRTQSGENLSFENFVSKPSPLADVKFDAASDEELLRMSSGEVKTPDTINYRSFRPFPGGIFDEQIFGPERKSACECGDILPLSQLHEICVRCGKSKLSDPLRMERFGHVTLGMPILAPMLKVKALDVLRLSGQDFNRIMIGDASLVTVEQAKLIQPKALSNLENGLLKLTPGSARVTKAWKERVTELMEGIQTGKILLDETVPRSSILELLAASQIPFQIFSGKAELDALLRSKGIEPRYQNAVLILPAAMRQMVRTSADSFNTVSLNFLYLKMIRSASRLVKLTELATSAEVLKHAQLALLESVDAVVGNFVESPKGCLLSALDEWPSQLLSWSSSFTARGVVIRDSSLAEDEIGVPADIAATLFQPLLRHQLNLLGASDSEEVVLSSQPDLYRKALEAALRSRPVLVAQSNDSTVPFAANVVIREGEAIRLHPSAADRLWDELAEVYLHLPLAADAVAELHSTKRTPVHEVMTDVITEIGNALRPIKNPGTTLRIPLTDLSQLLLGLAFLK